MLYLIFFFLELILLYFLAKRLTALIYRFFLRLTKNKNIASYLLAIVFLPGTFVHEASHILAALFLLVPFGEVEFLPQVQEDGIKLGSVGIAKVDPVRRFLIGVAPFIVGTLFILGGLYYLSQNNLSLNPYYMLITGYLIFAIGNTMFASKKDLEGALELFILVAIIFGLGYLLEIRLPLLDERVVLSKELIRAFKTSDLFLIIPLTIDSLIVIIFKFLKL